jgi:hypothetical protein
MPEYLAPSYRGHFLYPLTFLPSRLRAQSMRSVTYTVELECTPSTLSEHVGRLREPLRAVEEAGMPSSLALITDFPWPPTKFRPRARLRSVARYDPLFHSFMLHVCAVEGARVSRFGYAHTG